jgi:hypothetical protein
MPKRERWFSLSAIERAITTAGLEPAQRDRFLRELERTMPKRGRKAEPDSAAINKVLGLVGTDEEPAMTYNAAAAIVAQDYPPASREAVRKRLARKVRALRKEAEAEIAAETRTAELRRRQEAAERQIKAEDESSRLKGGSRKLRFGP